MPLFSFTSVVVLYILTLVTRSENRRLKDPIATILELIILLRGITATLAPIFPRVYSFATVVYGIWPAD